MSFTVEFVLGSDVVKAVVFPQAQGVRTLRSSGGQKIGRVVLMKNKVRFELDETAANVIANAQFH